MAQVLSQYHSLLVRELTSSKTSYPDVLRHWGELKGQLNSSQYGGILAHLVARAPKDVAQEASEMLESLNSMAIAV